MANQSSLRVCFVDNIGGSYLAQAVKLAPYFSKAYYHTAVQNPFPYVAPAKVGEGYKEIEILQDFWSSLDQFDLVVFCDIYFKSWGPALKKAGKLVWGGGPSEDIETNRQLFYGMLDRLGMNNGDYIVIRGITKLKSYLLNKTNRFVKVSYYRGQFETFNWINQAHNGVLLDEIEYNLGPLGDEIQFIVQSPIKSDSELGFDGYAVNGNLPDTFLTGIEIKNAGYLGVRTTTASAPAPVTTINEQFSPALKSYQHTGFYSTEVRDNSKTDEQYYIDACMRAGSPPSNTYISMIDNWDEILVQGANGTLVEPHFKAKYGCEIILKSSFVNHNFLPVAFDPAFKDNVCLKGSFIKNDMHYVIPFLKTCAFELQEFGSVVVIGNDVNQIMKDALDIASKVEGYDIDYSKTCLEDAMEQINNLEQTLNFKF